MFYILKMIVDIFFFFQAEDGIRDTSVTGVQTCALPIWSRISRRRRSSWGSNWRSGSKRRISSRSPKCGGPTTGPTSSSPRSEERRVGKECRNRCVADDEKKKKDIIEVNTEKEEK